MRFLLVVPLVVLLGARTTAPSPPAPSPTASSAPIEALSPAGAARVDATVQQAMDTYRIPGGEIAIVSNGNIIYRRGYGVRNITSERPVNATTRFEIGSITKQFTAVAIMQLVEDGRLSLDDRLVKFIGSYPAANDVTIRQLLWQTTGIPNYTAAKNFVSLAERRPGTFVTMMNLIANKPLRFTPGSRWEYSNSNYIILGRIIELVSGQSYTDYLFSHVIKPAGMNQTATIADEGHLTDFATGYGPNKSGTKLNRAPRFGSGWAWAAGYLVSNVDDLAAWDNAFFGGRIIAPKDVTLATSPGMLSDGKPTMYGFGWVVDSQYGHRRIWHNGGTFGFNADNMTYPDDHLAIIALFNQVQAPAESITAKIFDALHPELVPAHPTPAPNEDLSVTARAKEWIGRIQTGRIDRSQLSATMSKALTPDLVAGAKAQFGRLGPARTLTYLGKSTQGASTVYVYRVDFARDSLNLILSIDVAGKIDGLLFRPI
ncbi:MAG: beta-lactamase family protein [Candidatus Eremiobacteraeota bacterium]|nr:beta-lactamase family protein [Candidatus Eremiobacteraeota bacterium]